MRKAPGDGSTVSGQGSSRGCFFPACGGRIPSVAAVGAKGRIFWRVPDTIGYRAARMLGRYASYQLPEVIYFSRTIVTSISMAVFWWYATSDQKLVDPDIDPALITYNYARISSLPVVVVLAIITTFFSTAAGYAVLLLFPVRPVANLCARRRLS